MSGGHESQMSESVLLAKVPFGTDRVRRINLSQGKVAIVDADDYERLSRWKWCTYRVKNTNTFYALRNIYFTDGRHTTERMHCAIMGLSGRGPLMVDHINRDGLDNRKCNLRIVTGKVNRWNSNLSVNNTSGYRGVWFNKRAKKWETAVTIHLGYFNTPIEAALAYDKAIVKYRGNNAILNFPKEEEELCSSAFCAEEAVQD